MGAQHVLTAVAWPYANGPRHIGHIAGFGIPSDVFARFRRMSGDQVLMVSGTDEHGTPIQVQADREGTTAQELVSRYNRVIVNDLNDLGLSYDLFTRTATRNHHNVVKKIFSSLYRNGYIVERSQRSAISPSTGRTLPDRYIEGACPICGYDGARGDQCENCGNQLEPQDLINPRSKISGEVPQFVDSPQMFLELPAFAETLGKWLESRVGWRSNVLNFSLRLVEDLKPRAITRDLDWGVHVPLPGWEDRDDKRIYVWFDAVIGYLSASVEWARRKGDSDAWQPWWSENAAAVYFMGKDNVVFHTVIWPSMLLGASGRPHGEPGAFGVLRLPSEVASSEFLTMEGKKFSSSRSVVIYVRDVLDRYGADALRFFLAAAGPETSDTDFTWDQFVVRNNTELVAGWGNLVQRSLSLVAKNLGKIPAPHDLKDVDHDLLAGGRSAFDVVGESLAHSHVRTAMTDIMRLVSSANKYLSDQEPWKLVNADPARFETVMHCALQLVSDCNTLLTPVIPEAADRVAAMLGHRTTWAGQPRIDEVTDLDDGRPYPVITGDYDTIAPWQSRPIVTDTAISPPTPLFRKLDSSIVDEELARLERDAAAP
ncbi:MAG: methionine--tRNA ligase [Actinomycetota bacterium]